MDDAEAFEADNRRRMAQETDDLERREREQEDRRRRDGFPPGPPHHSNAGSIPIHQPVASRISGAIHSPGGLLANHGSAAPPMPLGGPSGPPANFGGPLQADPARPPQHGGPSNGPAQHQMFAPISHPTNPPNAHPGAPGGPPPIFGGPLQQREVSQALQQAPFGGGGGGAGGGGANTNNPGAQAPPNQAQGGPGPGGGLAQGQQPILNVSGYNLVSSCAEARSNRRVKSVAILQDLDWVDASCHISAITARHHWCLQKMTILTPLALHGLDSFVFGLLFEAAG